MTNDKTFEQFEEICHLLNDTPRKRKQVEEDLIFKQCLKAGDFPEAYQVAYGIIYGSAKNRTECRRLIKKRRREE